MPTEIDGNISTRHPLLQMGVTETISEIKEEREN